MANLSVAKQAMTGSSPETIKRFEEGMKTLSGGDINSVIMDLQIAVNHSIADRRMVIEVYYKRRYIDSLNASSWSAFNFLFFYLNQQYDIYT
jgi:hypothetical protein